jgi:hypothetical protein
MGCTKEPITDPKGYRARVKRPLFVHYKDAELTERWTCCIFIKIQAMVHKKYIRFVLGYANVNLIKGRLLAEKHVSRGCECGMQVNS